MNVTEKNWQSSATAAYGVYGSGKSSKTEDSEIQSSSADPSAGISKYVPDTDVLETSALSVAGMDSASKSSNSSFKMKTSGPENSVGQLAAMLSQAETIIDVQQVMSKAMRAMAELKMAAVGSEGKDAKKYAQQIKRMEKLIKRIQKKLKNLSKEQRMEEQRKKALKNAEEKKAQEIEKELRARRKKRRNEERRYAMKELSEDRKSGGDDPMSSMLESLPGMSTPGMSTPDISAVAGMAGDIAAGGEMAVDFSGMEGMSIDISV